MHNPITSCQISFSTTYVFAHVCETDGEKNGSCRVTESERNRMSNRPSDDAIEKVITVCFFSFGIFYDDVTPRVLEIIEFWKKFLEDIGNAFYDVKFAGLFYKNLNHLTGEEMLIKISQNHHFLKFLAEQIFFKLLSFLNGLS